MEYKKILLEEGKLIPRLSSEEEKELQILKYYTNSTHNVEFDFNSIKVKRNAIQNVHFVCPTPQYDIVINSFDEKIPANSVTYIDELPSLTKEDYIFEGYTRSESSNKICKANELVGDTSIFYAKWAKDGFDVNYYDGTKLIETRILKSMELPTISKDGYDFLGWRNDYGLITTSYTLTKDTNVYACWEAKSYHITLDYNGANHGESYEVTLMDLDEDDNYVLYKKISVSKTDLTSQSLPSLKSKGGKVFAGWSLDKVNSIDRKTILKDSVTLYALYSNFYFPYSAYVTSFNPLESSYSSKKLINDDSESGYKVFYYSTSNISGSTTVKIRNNSTCEIIIYLVGKSGSVKIYENEKFSSSDYMNFTVNYNGFDCICIYIGKTNKTNKPGCEAIVNSMSYSYSLSYEENYDDVVLPVTYGSEYSLPTPTREGYTFLGWYKGDKMVSDGVYEYLQDLSLVAKWEKN